MKMMWKYWRCDYSKQNERLYTYIVNSTRYLGCLHFHGKNCFYFSIVLAKRYMRWRGQCCAVCLPLRFQCAVCDSGSLCIYYGIFCASLNTYRFLFCFVWCCCISTLLLCIKMARNMSVARCNKLAGTATPVCTNGQVKWNEKKERIFE